MSAELKRLFDVIYYQKDQFPQPSCLSSKENGDWKKWSTEEVIEHVNAFSRGLLAMGIQPGDKIALISNNRPEWCVADLGTLQVGAVDVPIYPTISEEDYKYIFNHAEIKLCIVSDEELLGKVRSIENEVETLKAVYTFDQIRGADHWTKILDAGSDEYQEKVDEIKSKVKSEDLASIIYTSGTTGLPKGVMLSHWNILSNAIGSKKRLPVSPNSRSLSFLPVCHIYERMLLYLYMLSGVSIYFAESLDTIGDNLREVKPQVFTAVPRLLEKVYDKIIEKGASLSGIKKALFFWAVSVAEKWEPYGNTSGWYKFKHSIADKLIFSKWREAVGGNAQAVASGSAALQPRLARVFNAAGIPVMEGYGLTETSPVIAVNEMDNRGFMIGTVGRVLEKVEVKIADDGEILCKGPNVMMGYYKDPERTDDVMTDKEWFHTGDIGEFTGPKHDFLKITDRKKEMFKTSGGKYVAPQPIENMLKSSRFIENAIIVGEGQKHPAVIVVPNFENVEFWYKKHNVKCGSDKEIIIQNQKVIDRIWEEVINCTDHLGRWEQPKKMELCATEWTIDGGELTPTLKLKRRVVHDKYNHLIEKIYS
jgi:long-chain acyl-CoA synthetase